MIIKCKEVKIIGKWYEAVCKPHAIVKVLGLRFDADLDHMDKLSDFIRSNPEIFGKFKHATLHPVYDTPSGELEPGSMFYADWLPENFYWDNHKGPMLHVVLPNGHIWNIDSRASNCTMKDDRTHRCWVRHGDIPNITVDKNGHTCQAGAGSILVDDWHGFLKKGELIKC